MCRSKVIRLAFIVGWWGVSTEFVGVVASCRLTQSLELISDKKKNGFSFACRRAIRLRTHTGTQSHLHSLQTHLLRYHRESAKCVCIRHSNGVLRTKENSFYSILSFGFVYFISAAICSLPLYVPQMEKCFLFSFLFSRLQTHLWIMANVNSERCYSTRMDCVTAAAR